MLLNLPALVHGRVPSIPCKKQKNLSVSIAICFPGSCYVRTEHNISVCGPWSVYRCCWRSLVITVCLTLVWTCTWCVQSSALPKYIQCRQVTCSFIADSHDGPNCDFRPRTVYHVTSTSPISVICASSADARTDEVERLFTLRFLAGDLLEKRSVWQQYNVFLVFCFWRIKTKMVHRCVLCVCRFILSRNSWFYAWKKLQKPFPADTTQVPVLLRVRVKKLSSKLV